MAHTKYTANYSFTRYFRLDGNAMAAASVWKGGDGVRVAPVSMGCSKLGQSLGQARWSRSGVDKKKCFFDRLGFGNAREATAGGSGRRVRWAHGLELGGETHTSRSVEVFFFV